MTAARWLWLLSVALTLPWPASANELGERRTGIRAAADPVQHTFRYSFVLRNSRATAIADATFRSFAPVPRTPTQRVTRLVASREFETTEDVLGNRTLGFPVALPGFGSLVIRVETDIEFADGPRSTAAPPVDSFLAPERFVEVDSRAIQELADSLGPGSPAEIAERAYSWVVANIARQGYVADDRGALYALRSGAGDCTEAMYLFMALARARGVPARSVEGFVVRGDAVLRSEDVHNWAEYYADGRWHVADPNQEVFGHRRDRRYLTFRWLGRDDTVRRYSASGEALVVRMN